MERSLQSFDAAEARALTEGYLRAATTTRSEGWSACTQGISATATAATPILENASSRRRRLALSGSLVGATGPEPRNAPRGFPSARVADVPHRQSRAPLDSQRAMEERQQQLAAAREERRQRETLRQAAQLEAQAIAERDLREARELEARRAEEHRQQLEIATAEARKRLEAEREEFEADIKRKARLRSEQARAQWRLEEQLQRLQRQRATLRAANQAESTNTMANPNAVDDGPVVYSTSLRRRPPTQGAQRRWPGTYMPAAPPQTADPIEEEEALLVRQRTLGACAAVFGDWRQLLLRSRRQQVCAERHFCWRLRRRCFATWVAWFHISLLGKAADAHEQRLRATQTSMAVASGAHRVRVLMRCVRKWFVWTRMQAQLRKVEEEHAGRTERIQRLLASLSHANASTANASAAAVAPSSPSPAPQAERKTVPPSSPASAHGSGREPQSTPTHDEDADRELSKLSPPPTPPTPPPPVLERRATELSETGGVVSESARARDAKPAGTMGSREGAEQTYRAASAMLGLSWRSRASDRVPGPVIEARRSEHAGAPAHGATASHRMRIDGTQSAPSSRGPNEERRTERASAEAVSSAVLSAVEMAVATAVSREPMESFAPPVVSTLPRPSEPGTTRQYLGRDHLILKPLEPGAARQAAVEPQVAADKDESPALKASHVATPTAATPSVATPTAAAECAAMQSATAAAEEQQAAEEESPETTPPKPTLPDLTGTAQVLATPTSASAMYYERLQKRADERRARRQDLQRRYQEGQRAAQEAAQQAAVQQAEQQAEERRRRAAQQRALREESEARRQRLAYGQARWQLAVLHSARARLVRCGWRPWRTLVLFAREQEQSAFNHRVRALLNPVIVAWARRVRQRRARHCCFLAVACIRAQRLCARHTMRCGLLALGQGAGRQRRLVVAARRFLGVALLRRLWIGWQLLVELTRERVEADALHRELIGAAHADSRALRHAFVQWHCHAALCRFEAVVASKRQDLWQKVNGWLGELPLG